MTGVQTCALPISVRNMQWFEITETRGHIRDGKVAHWQVTLKVGFTLEPCQPLRVGGHALRQKLDGHVASQARVLSAIHFAHPAFADFRKDAVMGDLRI